jgi:type IV secretion system protein VirB9
MKRLVIFSALLVAGAVVSSAALESRSIKYRNTDVVHLACKMRHTTLVVLPDGEKIVDFVVGDKDFWQLEGGDNFAYIKPAKAGSRTTITLITQAGNIYSFLADEVSSTAGSDADLKVFVELVDDRLLANLNTRRRYVPAPEADALRDVIISREAQEQQQRKAFAADYSLKLDFKYRFKRGSKPFLVDAVWNDGRATFIRSGSNEKAALYELKDGEPALINYELKDGVYIIPKVIEAGYLAVGKERLPFRRGE